MESRTQDVKTVSRLRSARLAVVAQSHQGNLDAVFSSDTGSFESQTYVVKVLDVFPGLGKVSGRRLMGDIGIAPLAKIADLTASQRESLSKAIEALNV